MACSTLIRAVSACSSWPIVARSLLVSVVAGSLA